MKNEKSEKWNGGTTCSGAHLQLLMHNNVN